MKILQVNTTDGRGGAAKITRQLLEGYQQRGHQAWFAVGEPCLSTPAVLRFPTTDNQSAWFQMCQRFEQAYAPFVGRFKGSGRFHQLLKSPVLTQPLRTLHHQLGWEFFAYPASRQLLKRCPQIPEIVHCHNLHGSELKEGGYFDLRFLAPLSHAVPTVLTLHDAWLLSGHCAHSFTCDRWQTGCGQCPDLTIPPSIQRDGTARNWKQKRAIYQKSRLYVATPSHWLMQKVEQSMLWAGVVEARVIPNGMDLTCFKAVEPSDRQVLRAALGIPQDTKVLLFVANYIRTNPWKDYAMLEAAIARLSSQFTTAPLLCLTLGDETFAKRVGQVEIRSLGHFSDPSRIAQIYQTADVYLHAAKADTFPNTVLEALACGLPVVATGVGGIPEQVTVEKTGFLVPPGDAAAMAFQIQRLLEDPELWQQMSVAAADRARHHFDQELMVDRYLEWYSEILQRSQLTVLK
ncbi:MAG: glycosyltransferase [Leptolyngbyaceae cyanobacterium bins.59]|nr:glycosyltransferase [Leptolyngbyaceae cyanobacterium bins.59]